MRTRERLEPCNPANYTMGTTYRYVGPTMNPPTGRKMNDYVVNECYNINPIFREVEHTVDEIHKGPPYRNGGEFYKYKIMSPSPFLEGPLVIKGKIYYGTPPNGDWWYEYRGLISLAGNIRPPTGWYSTLEPTDLVPTYGAQAWDALRPVKPGASLAQFLAELRDVPRMLKQTHRMFLEKWKTSPKRMAGDWLNYQFGWLPFVSDLRRLFETARKLDQLVESIRRYNGKWIYRRRVIDSTEDSSVVEGNPLQITIMPGIPYYFWKYYDDTSVPRCTWTKTTRTFQNVWAVGRFRYYIPDTGSWQWKQKAYLYLLGALPQPSLLWELTPYSWLVDWFTNLGDIFANLDYEFYDNLAVKYLYLMRTKRFEFEVKLLNHFYQEPLASTYLFHYEQKERRQASYFGFGLTEDDFSARQWSILAALGIQKFT